MTRTSPAQFAFSSGEISPLLWRRPDYQRFQTGLAACRGYLPLRQGGFTRAPGTIYRGTTRNNLPARLIDFQFATNDSVVLEFTDGKMRVWRYGELIEDPGNPGNPYELTTPYDDASIARLHWVQSADVIYFVDGLQPMQKLSRFALDNWTIAAADHDRGPFRVQNLDKNLTLQATGAAGTIQLTASQSFFQAGHVGSVIRLSAANYSDVPLWTGNTSISVGDKMRYDGNTYEVVVGTDTGVNPPTHKRGVEQVQKSPNVKWRHLDDGAGVVKIITVMTDTVAVADVTRRLPQGVVDDPTYRFEEGAWSDVYGYPSAIEIYDQRLVAAATPNDPRTIWFSAIGAYENFYSGIEADSSFVYAIDGGSSVNRVLWLKRGRSGLHIGALGEEYSTKSADGNVAIGPTTTVFQFDSAIGSRGDVRPIAPDGWPIFVSRDGRRVIEIKYNFEQDTNRPRELSLPSDHLGADGFEELVWSAAPQRIAWARRGNGELAAMIHDPSEEVLGWAPYSLAGGFVESTTVTADAAGSYDVLTMVVRRTVGGQTVRMVEEQAVTYGLLTGNEPISNAVHLFASSVFAPATPTDTFSVPHLAGETVEAWTDAGDFGGLVVAGNGDVTLPNDVGHAVIGFFDATHRARTLDIQAAAPDGNPMGRKKRLSMPTGIGVHRTAAGKVAVVEKDFPTRESIGRPYDLIPRAVAEDLTVAYSGIAKPEFGSGNADEVALEFTPVSGAPMTITGLVPAITEAGL